MLLATCLALGSAVLHAGWNLAAKRAEGDRFVVLWAQFAVSGAIAAVILVFAIVDFFTSWAEGHPILHIMGFAAAVVVWLIGRLCRSFSD